ncbi:MAG: hypothetical protein M1814_005427 [Vezdaea aestivalis]|nr:MAG: hypothetical protein M1814_005427 [Vezdaea aestivalis]
MSTLTLTEHLQSPTIRLVTPTGTEYLVHRTLLTAHLPSLTLPPRRTYLDLDVAPSTLALFLSYLYTSDYQLPSSSSTKHNSHSPLTPQIASPAAHAMVRASRSSSLGVWGGPAAVHTSYFHETAGNADGAANPHSLVGVVRSESPTPPRGANGINGAHHWESECGEEEGAFEAHAGVYAFAARFGNRDLAALSLGRLEEAVKGREGTGWVVDFIQQVYGVEERAGVKQKANGGVSERKKAGRSGLRDLAVKIALDRLEELAKDERFRAFARKEGKQAGDGFGYDLYRQLMLTPEKTRLGLELLGIGWHGPAESDEEL